MLILILSLIFPSYCPLASGLTLTHLDNLDTTTSKFCAHFLGRSRTDSRINTFLTRDHLGHDLMSFTSNHLEATGRELEIHLTDTGFTGPILRSHLTPAPPTGDTLPPHPTAPPPAPTPNFLKSSSNLLASLGLYLNNLTAPLTTRTLQHLRHSTTATHDSALGTTSFPRPCKPGQNPPVGLATSAAAPTNDNLLYAHLGPHHTRLLAHASTDNPFRHPSYQSALNAAQTQHSSDAMALHGFHEWRRTPNDTNPLTSPNWTPLLPPPSTTPPQTQHESNSLCLSFVQSTRLNPHRTSTTNPLGARHSICWVENTENVGLNFVPGPYVIFISIFYERK